MTIITANSVYRLTPINKKGKPTEFYRISGGWFDDHPDCPITKFMLWREPVVGENAIFCGQWPKEAKVKFVITSPIQDIKP